MGIVDGLGGEEVNQDVNVQTGSIVATGPIFTAGLISGAGNITGSGVANNNGDLRSTSIENATELFGYKVKAGSVLFGDGVSGLVEFATSFADPNYFLVCTARDWGVPWSSSATASGIPFTASGTRRASGLWLYGGSGAIVDWIAVGM